MFAYNRKPMGRALYRKYRPKSLGDVVGQEHITTTISNAISSGKISHAYLLTGTRGVGKTSLARILAHEINSLEYVDDTAQLDIIEIDAASNRRIDEIRDLRDKVHILPTSNKYKVYIIDEVHMLTKEAFNALLKTLEEPPAHAVFILATTEAHKLPDTIVSRTQHFSFKPIEAPVIVKHLRTIAKAEKINIDDNALELVAQHGDGSFRDSISLLDQVRGLSEHITLEQVEQLLGVASSEAVTELLTAIDAKDPQQVFAELKDLRGQGFMSGQLAKQLSGILRERIIKNIAHQNTANIQLLAEMLKVSGSPQADRLLELALLEYMFFDQTPAITVAAPPMPIAPVKPVSSTSSKPSVPQQKSSAMEAKTPVAPSTPDKSVETTPKVHNKKETTSKAASVDSSDGFSLDGWPVVVAEVKKTHNTLYSILRMAEPRIEEDKLLLAFRFPFHQKQLNNEKNRKIIGDVIHRVTGSNIAVTCVIDKESKPDLNVDVKNNTIASVSDIFGGAEVLDS